MRTCGLLLHILLWRARIALVLLLLGTFGLACGPALAQEGGPDPVAHVEAPRKTWDVGTPIGYGGFNNPPLDNGRILAPGTETAVAPGGTVNLVVEKATDRDHWRYQNTEDFPADEVPDPPLNYAWSCTGGDFVDEAGAPITAPHSLTATWKAPATRGVVTLSCTIDDKPLPMSRDASDESTRDDTALVRHVKVYVTDFKAELKV